MQELFGSSFTGVKDFKINLIDEKNNIEDISGKVKFLKDKTQVTIESLVGRDIGLYTFEFIVNNASFTYEVRV